MTMKILSPPPTTVRCDLVTNCVIRYPGATAFFCSKGQAIYMSFIKQNTLFLDYLSGPVLKGQGTTRLIYKT